MTPEQFKNLEISISNQIKTTVNGKIDRINDKLDKYIIDDNQWKADVKPYIENMRQMTDFTTIGSAIMKFIITIGGSVAVIWALIKYLK